MLPFDYRGQNVTLDFEDKVGKLGWSAALKELLDINKGRGWGRCCVTSIELRRVNSEVSMV